jgi:hypothetical protein
MNNLLPRTPEGIVVSTVMLFVFVWQAKSALLLFGIQINSMVHLWVMLATLGLYIVFVFVALGATEIQSQAAHESETATDSQPTSEMAQ